jgi:MFS family permease
MPQALRKGGRMSGRWGLPEIRGYWPLVWAMVIDTLGTGLFLPFTILYFLATTNLSVADIGFGLAIAGGVSLPFGPVCGNVADRFGPRAVIVGSNVARMIGFVGFLGVHNFPELLLASLAVQIGNRAFYTAQTPLITQVAPPGQRERWFGFIGAVRNTGFALGGVIAGIALTGGGKAAYDTIVVVNAASFGLAAVLLLRIKLRPLPGANEPVSGLGGWRTVLADRAYLILTAVNTTIALAENAIDVVLPVYLVHILKLPAWTAGAAFGLNCVLVAFAQGPVVMVIEGRGRTRLLVLAGGISAVSALVFLAADGLPEVAALALIALGVLLFSAAELISSPVMSVLSAEAAPDALRGRYIAMFQVSWTVANSGGVAVLGWLLSLGPVPTWIFMAGLSVAGSVGVGSVGKRLERNVLRAGEAGAAARAAGDSEQPVPDDTPQP